VTDSVRRKRGVRVATVGGLLVLALGVMPIAPMGAAAKTTVMRVTCLDWFLHAGQKQHIHVEAHMQDSTGQPVVGATVTFTTSFDRHDGTGPHVYATNTGTTTDNAGKNRGAGCPAGTGGSATTGFFCCIGAGKWNGEIPGKRSCPAGFYHADVITVTPPPGSSLAWDGVTPVNGMEFADVK